MPTRALTRPTLLPSVFDDFFKPLSQWFDDSGLVNKVTITPSVNIVETPVNYTVSMAAPGLKKEDFSIELQENVLTISSEMEQRKEEKDEKYTRKEYSYTSFSRSFTLPEDVKQDSIDAQYEDGVLKITLPRKEEAKKNTVSKMITVK